MNQVQQINIDNVLKEKSPRLYKILPRFIINWLKKTLHEKDINQILKDLEEEHEIAFINNGLKKLGVKSEGIGTNNIPKKNGVILVANHPLGGLDGVAMIQQISNVRNDINFLVNDVLTHINKLKPYFIPINKHGKNSRKNLLKIDELYKSDSCIVLFPAGLVSRRQLNNKIEDLEWKKSFVTKARKHNKTIIPVHVNGLNSSKFYNLSYWRKKLRIKLNIEMLFLADEMFKQQGATITFTFGKAINPEKLHKGLTDLEWAQKIKNHVYELENNPNFELSN
jgi:putative hemolysin